jgi:hypothetical protein
MMITKLAMNAIDIKINTAYTSIEWNWMKFNEFPAALKCGAPL